ncbi:uncharacterized protein A1O9_07812 [Exophiala aquamarina CBS 119918]|uniref:SnoaL-like domain-containing protein n=1 Tax=Exophiala aquamarina CBS 119918 TaxID=1182545 RepID=A0A072P8Q1_9EURO|nr:uncharacterized protein A1O9_07812 [Exophiala aquamarina CBS 119918]KEF56231.1 hypothetical protein A1O9_07812 [Exophiala aquamarina CBS 119918]
MHSLRATSLLLPLLSAGSALAHSRWGPTSIASPCQSVEISAEWRETIISNWLTIWNDVDFSLLDVTVSPEIVIYQDRFATGTGNGSIEFPVNNVTAFQRFVEGSRAGFSKYAFEATRYFGEDDLVALEWTLNAIVESGQGTAAPGTAISYNGTDIFVLDRCDGVVKEVRSHQDLIRYYNQLGVDVGTP